MIGTCNLCNVDTLGVRDSKSAQHVAQFMMPSICQNHRVHSQQIIRLRTSVSYAKENHVVPKYLRRHDEISNHIKSPPLPLQFLSCLGSPRVLRLPHFRYSSDCIGSPSIPSFEKHLRQALAAKPVAVVTGATGRTGLLVYKGLKARKIIPSCFMNNMLWIAWPFSKNGNPKP